MAPSKTPYRSQSQRLSAAQSQAALPGNQGRAPRPGNPLLSSRQVNSPLLPAGGTKLNTPTKWQPANGSSSAQGEQQQQQRQQAAQAAGVSAGVDAYDFPEDADDAEEQLQRVLAGSLLSPGPSGAAAPAAGKQKPAAAGLSAAAAAAALSRPTAGRKQQGFDKGWPRQPGLLTNCPISVTGVTAKDSVAAGNSSAKAPQHKVQATTKGAFSSAGLAFGGTGTTAAAAGIGISRFSFSTAATPAQQQQQPGGKQLDIRRFARRALPTSTRFSEPLPAGMLNHGNTCYLNAILQALLSLPCLALDLGQYNCNGSSSKGGGSKGDSSSSSSLSQLRLPPDGVTAAMQACLRQYQAACSRARGQSGDSAAAISPQVVREAMKARASHWGAARQEDAHEFLTALLNGLADEVQQAQLEFIERARKAKAGSSKQDGGALPAPPSTAGGAAAADSADGPVDVEAAAAATAAATAAADVQLVQDPDLLLDADDNAQVSNAGVGSSPAPAAAAAEADGMHSSSPEAEQEADPQQTPQQQQRRRDAGCHSNATAPARSSAAAAGTADDDHDDDGVAVSRSTSRQPTPACALPSMSVSQSMCPVTRNFLGCMQHTYTCSVCGKQTVQKEQFNHLILDLPTADSDAGGNSSGDGAFGYGSSSGGFGFGSGGSNGGGFGCAGSSSSAPVAELSALLANHFAPETCGKACEGCGAAEVQHKVEHALRRLPRVLVVQLKRFQWVVSAGGIPDCRKVPTPVQPDQQLFLGRLCVPGRPVPPLLAALMPKRLIRSALEAAGEPPQPPQQQQQQRVGSNGGSAAATAAAVADGGLQELPPSCNGFTATLRRECGLEHGSPSPGHQQEQHDQQQQQQDPQQQQQQKPRLKRLPGLQLQREGLSGKGAKKLRVVQGGQFSGMPGNQPLSVLQEDACQQQQQQQKPRKQMQHLPPGCYQSRPDGRIKKFARARATTPAAADTSPFAPLQHQQQQRARSHSPQPCGSDSSDWQQQQQQRQRQWYGGGADSDCEMRDAPPPASPPPVLRLQRNNSSSAAPLIDLANIAAAADSEYDRDLQEALARSLLDANPAQQQQGGQEAGSGAQQQCSGGDQQQQQQQQEWEDAAGGSDGGQGVAVMDTSVLPDWVNDQYRKQHSTAPPPSPVQDWLPGQDWLLGQQADDDAAAHHHQQQQQAQADLEELYGIDWAAAGNAQRTDDSTKVWANSSLVATTPGSATAADAGGAAGTALADGIFGLTPPLDSPQQQHHHQQQQQPMDVDGSRSFRPPSLAPRQDRSGRVSSSTAAGGPQRTGGAVGVAAMLPASPAAAAVAAALQRVGGTGSSAQPQLLREVQEAGLTEDEQLKRAIELSMRALNQQQQGQQGREGAAAGGGAAAAAGAAAGGGNNAGARAAGGAGGGDVEMLVGSDVVEDDDAVMKRVLAESAAEHERQQEQQELLQLQQQQEREQQEQALKLQETAGAASGAAAGGRAGGEQHGGQLPERPPVLLLRLLEDSDYEAEQEELQTRTRSTTPSSEDAQPAGASAAPAAAAAGVEEHTAAAAAAEGKQQPAQQKRKRGRAHKHSQHQQSQGDGNATAAADAPQGRRLRPRGASAAAAPAGGSSGRDDDVGSVGHSNQPPATDAAGLWRDKENHLQAATAGAAAGAEAAATGPDTAGPDTAGVSDVPHKAAASCQASVQQQRRVLGEILGANRDSSSRNAAAGNAVASAAAAAAGEPARKPPALAAAVAASQAAAASASAAAAGCAAAGGAAGVAANGTAAATGQAAAAAVGHVEPAAAAARDLAGEQMQGSDGGAAAAAGGGGSGVQELQEAVAADAVGAWPQEAAASYSLSAVVRHMGELVSVGHFTSDVLNAETQHWYHYDDSYVRALPGIEAVARSCRRDGYLFFYLNDAISDS